MAKPITRRRAIFLTSVSALVTPGILKDLSYSPENSYSWHVSYDPWTQGDPAEERILTQGEGLQSMYSHLRSNGLPLASRGGIDGWIKKFKEKAKEVDHIIKKSKITFRNFEWDRTPAPGVAHEKYDCKTPSGKTIMSIEVSVDRADSRKRYGSYEIKFDDYSLRILPLLESQESLQKRAGKLNPEGGPPACFRSFDPSKDYIFVRDEINDNWDYFFQRRLFTLPEGHLGREAEPLRRRFSIEFWNGGRFVNVDMPEIQPGTKEFTEKVKIYDNIAMNLLEKVPFKTIS